VAGAEDPSKRVRTHPPASESQAQVEASSLDALWLVAEAAEPRSIQKGPAPKSQQATAAILLAQDLSEADGQDLKHSGDESEASPNKKSEHKHGMLPKKDAPKSGNKGGAKPPQPKKAKKLPPKNYLVEAIFDDDKTNELPATGYQVEATFHDDEEAGSEGELEYDPENEEDFFGDPIVEDEDRTVTRDDFVSTDMDEKRVLSRVLQESDRAARLKDYKWAESTIKFVDIPDSFQDLKSMGSKKRRGLMQGVPKSRNTFPCKGVNSMGNESGNIKVPSELWFLLKGAPTIHNLLTQELRALLFMVQEVGDAPEKMGLTYLRTLLPCTWTL